MLEHNEDGSHNFSSNGKINDSIRQIIDGYQASGQWWKQGPWVLNTPELGGELQNRAILRPPDPAAGTYHNYQPPGIDTAIGASIEPTGDITLTGLYNADITKERMFFLRNRDSSASITLAHEDSGSLEAYQFQLPNDEDVVIGPRENVWLFYDSDRERWTYTITTTQSGGIPSGGVVSVVEKDITELQLESANTSPIVLVPATAGKIHFPVQMLNRVALTTAYTTSPTLSIRYGGVVQNISTTVDQQLNGAAPATTWQTITGTTTANLSSDSVNKSLVWFLNANPTGAGSATVKVRLVYFTVNGW